MENARLLAKYFFTQMDAEIHFGRETAVINAGIRVKLVGLSCSFA